MATSLVGLFDALFIVVGLEGPAISICYFKSTSDHAVGSDRSRGHDVSSLGDPRDPIRPTVADQHSIGPIDGICEWKSCIEFLLNIGAMQWCGAPIDAVSLSFAFEKYKD